MQPEVQVLIVQTITIVSSVRFSFSALTSSAQKDMLSNSQDVPLEGES